MSCARSLTYYRWQYVLFLCAALLLQGQALANAPFRWPGDVQAAVSLSYDDALDSQLDVAIPALNKHGFKASFYLQLSNPSVNRRMAEWRAAAQLGHELGNHTLFHQCSSAQADRAWVQAHRDLETTSVAQMKDQILIANAMLHAIDGKRVRTFTAPCGDLRARGENYLDAIKGDFVAIKAGGGTGIAASMAELDLHAVSVFAPADMSGKQLIDLVKAAVAKGTMLNLTFHGVGGDYLAISKEAHEQLLAYLAENRATIWTDTFLNIVERVKAQKNGKQAAIGRPAVSIAADGRSVMIKRSMDVVPVAVRILDQCGPPVIGQPKIRHFKVDAENLVVTFGKHCSANVSLRTLAPKCSGCD